LYGIDVVFCVFSRLRVLCLAWPASQSRAFPAALGVTVCQMVLCCIIVVFQCSRVSFLVVGCRGIVLGVVAVTLDVGYYM
jgi:hypothetical protein